MEKIININLQGRVIPIEETAYNGLRQYIDSLRAHFASEEGRDEIINDIENRIAELLTYRLKQGRACVNSADLDTVIESIGKLEDIEAADGEEKRQDTPQRAAAQSEPLRGRLCRNADDKIIAGVCSGIAARMGVDPVVVRIIFLVLMGALLWVYVVLWIVMPLQHIRTPVMARRLYRNPEDKVIGGVCGGLAQYFDVSSWIPRLLFVLPILIGLISHGVYTLWWDWNWGIGPRVFTGSLGGGLFILYLIMWIAIPYATSPTEKMEMRGERIDLNSLKAASQGNTVSAAPRASGFARLISILLKAFFLFVGGSIALGFFGVLIGFAFSSFAAAPFSGFFVDSWGQTMWLWTGMALVLGIPMLALVTWVVRRLMRVPSRRHYLGYVFSGLWIIGLVCLLSMAGVFVRNFRSRSVIEEQYFLRQPSGNKLYITVANGWRDKGNNYHRWWGYNWEEDGPFRMITDNTLWLNSVKVKIVRSSDSQYHVYENRISRGETVENARSLASHISFAISQQDSILTLPGGFTITDRDKFRNQQVMVVVEVPVGKKIQMSRDINDYSWYNINIDGRRDFYVEHEWHDDYPYRSNRSYLMTANGLRTTTPGQKNDDEEDDDDN